MAPGFRAGTGGPRVDGDVSSGSCGGWPRGDGRPAVRSARLPRGRAPDRGRDLVAQTPHGGAHRRHLGSGRPISGRLDDSGFLAGQDVVLARTPDSPTGVQRDQTTLVDVEAQDLDRDLVLDPQARGPRVLEDVNG